MSDKGRCDTLIEAADDMLRIARMVLQSAESHAATADQLHRIEMARKALADGPAARQPQRSVGPEGRRPPETSD